MEANGWELFSTERSVCFVDRYQTIRSITGPLIREGSPRRPQIRKQMWVHHLVIVMLSVQVCVCLFGGVGALVQGKYSTTAKNKTRNIKNTQQLMEWLRHKKETNTILFWKAYHKFPAVGNMWDRVVHSNWVFFLPRTMTMCDFIVQHRAVPDTMSKMPLNIRQAIVIQKNKTKED